MSEQPILKREIVIGGRAMILETGRLARQAGGAVFVRYGDTTVLSPLLWPKTSGRVSIFSLLPWIMKRGSTLLGRSRAVSLKGKAVQVKRLFFPAG